MAKPNTKEMSIQMQGSLAALAAEAAELSRLLLESGGELSPELEARLEVNAQQLPVKVDSYKFIMDEFEAQAAMWKARKDACAAIKDRFETRIESMKDRIRLAMRELNTAEVAGNQYIFQLRKGQAKLNIEDESAIPADFKMIVQTTVVDKEKLKAALADGFKVPGASLEENGRLCPIENSRKE